MDKIYRGIGKFVVVSTVFELTHLFAKGFIEGVIDGVKEKDEA